MDLHRQPRPAALATAGSAPRFHVKLRLPRLSARTNQQQSAKTFHVKRACACPRELYLTKQGSLRRASRTAAHWPPAIPNYPKKQATKTSQQHITSKNLGNRPRRRAVMPARPVPDEADARTANLLRRSGTNTAKPSRSKNQVEGFSGSGFRTPFLPSKGKAELG